mgnify:CR=1 FL=1
MDPITTQSGIASAPETIARLRTEIGRVVIGQQQIIDRLVIALLGRGDVLLEGMAGLPKTPPVKTARGKAAGGEGG